LKGKGARSAHSGVVIQEKTKWASRAGLPAFSLQTLNIRFSSPVLLYFRPPNSSGRRRMAKTVNCRDVGVGCDFVAREIEDVDVETA
jgi:hypothetical protein